MRVLSQNCRHCLHYLCYLALSAQVGLHVKPVVALIFNTIMCTAPALSTTALCCLQALTRVTKLNLYGCKRLTVQGLAKLVPLPLVALSLGQTRIRPDALDTLTRMRGLTELHLVREYMGTAIVKLTALNALEVLSLRSTELTNASATVSHRAPREGP